MDVNGNPTAFAGPHGGAYRPPLTCRNGVVTSAHYLASQAGARILMQGGNAIDAAVATAATLNVVEPYMSGIGGCGYMLVNHAASGQHHALDFMATTPAGLDPARVERHDQLADSSMGTFVPGNLAGWLAALDRFGTMDRATVFAPAIAYAEDGYAVSIRNSELIAASAPRLLRWGDGSPYLFDGRPPRHGETIRQPALAATFRAIVEGGVEPVYRGEIGRSLVRASEAAGGFLSMDDLARFKVEWKTPIERTYRGYSIRTVPPTSSGLQFLIDFGLLEGFDLASLGHNSVDHLHFFIEATKLAVADRIVHGANENAPVAELLADDYLATRRQLIDPTRAAISGGERFARRQAVGEVVAGLPREGGFRGENTTHFSVVDRAGNAVSVTQSLGSGFGCGAVARDVGLALNNFAFWMDRDPTSPNALGPGKRMECPMSPAQVFRDGRLVLAIGTPGGVGILQTTAQMISNVLDFGMNIQAAIEAPRIRCALPSGEDPAAFAIGGLDPNLRGSMVRLEDRIGPDVRAGLTARGHAIELLGPWSMAVGGGQGVTVDLETGAISGGADPRRDGYAIGF